MCVKDGVWERCVWKMVCNQDVCERWCVTKLCVTKRCVWMWKSCACVCVWKIVCDKVVCVCETWCVKDGVWQSCVWQRCVCVCVEHLNRCKTSTVGFYDSSYTICRGAQSTVETAPNEAIHLCWKQSLINSVYLRFQSLFLRHFVLWEWHAAKPRTAPPTFLDFMYVCRNLHSLWFHYTGVSFSPFQNSALNYGWTSSDLVFSPPFAFSFMEFPMITS